MRIFAPHKNFPPCGIITIYVFYIAETSGSGLIAAISVYSILLLLAGISIAILIIILVILVRERTRLFKELEAAKEFSTYEDVDISQFSNKAPKAANIDTDKNISYCPVSKKHVQL